MTCCCAHCRGCATSTGSSPWSAPLSATAYTRACCSSCGGLGIADRVAFAGAALETLWQEADLFALATHWEGYGMAVAEALKRRLPSAVSAGGATASLVPVRAGMISPPGDPEHLSEALRRVISSPALRQHMANVACEAGRVLPSWLAQIQAFADALVVNAA
jgi:glycosyltransferase involved in cell wall biosynthesis